MNLRRVNPINRPLSQTSTAEPASSEGVEPQSPLFRLIALKVRLVRGITREGAFRFARRKTAQAVNQVAERLRIQWLLRRPWFADDRPVFLLVNHHCGGGTERHVRQLCAKLRLEQIRPVLVRPSRAGILLWEERDDRERAIWCRASTHELMSIRSLLDLLGPAHAHVHHVIGVPLALVDLLTEHGVRYDWTIHDYYTICPRVNLINADQTYCGEPDAEACNHCLAKLGDDQGRPVPLSIEDWRDGFSRRLGNARGFSSPVRMCETGSRGISRT